MGDKVTIFKDDAGDWRWRRQAENGRIIAISGEGYENRSHAIRMVEALTIGQDVTVLVEE
jgi:uncharacterized protein YegP (UPF0339 family)